MKFSHRSLRVGWLVPFFLLSFAMIAACWMPVMPVISAADEALAIAIGQLPTEVYPAEMRDGLRQMVRDDLRRRLQQANDRSSADWRAIQDRAQWEAFAAERIGRMRNALGRFPEPPASLEVRKTGGFTGDGFVVENLIFRTRPGMWVTANLYLPAQARAAMPGILICHSHHRPKEQGELQDMGMTWARAGCAVLVMDQLGHGERRQHPFATAADFPQEFRVSRQDYYFRYDTSLQLYLVGESLMGWMAWDMMRGVDLLLARPGVDPGKIILLGGVAGGGDPAAVTAALDPRIAAAVPFNFGGPQPETRYPLPDDAEASFNYAGSGSWESTRNLHRSAADGFLPWVIVGSIAPRKLIFGHEFNWDRPRDPVWKRLEKIYGFFDAADGLAFAHGRGELSGQPPEATHCGNIGRFHRQNIHVAFKQWFGIEVTGADEYSANVDASKLLCLTPEVQREIDPQPLHRQLESLAEERLAAARQQREKLSPEQRREHLRQSLAPLLGDVRPVKALVAQPPTTVDLPGQCRMLRVALLTADQISLPCLLLLPAKRDGVRSPVVVGLSQAGKQQFLQQRSQPIAALLERGVAVCLPDLRGIGETRGDADRSAESGDTSRSASELMLGGTMLGARLRDLRTVIGMLRQHEEIDADRVALWGDSMVEPNSADATFAMPRRVDGRPRQPEPLGAMLAVLGGLFDDQICAVVAAGGCVDFQSVLNSQFVALPHDAVVPGLLTVADLDDLTAALSPRPLRLERTVDGWNRRTATAKVQAAYPLTDAAYRAAQSDENFSMGEVGVEPAKSTDWWLGALRG